MGEKNKLKKQKDKKKKKNKEQLIFLREQGIAQAKQLNLMSNVFISVALNDIPACQHNYYRNQGSGGKRGQGAKAGVKVAVKVDARARLRARLRA